MQKRAYLLTEGWTRLFGHMENRALNLISGVRTDVKFSLPAVFGRFLISPFSVFRQIYHPEIRLTVHRTDGPDIRPFYHSVSCQISSIQGPLYMSNISKRRENKLAEKINYCMPKKSCLITYTYSL